MLADLPFPETLPALAHQLRLLRDRRKRLVLLPHGLVPPGSLHDLHTRETARGTFVAADPDELMNLNYALEHEMLGLLLGYGIPRKPDTPDRVITLRDGASREVFSVATDAGGEPAVRAALEEMAGDAYQVTTGRPETVLRERAAWWLHFFQNLQSDTP